MGVQINGSTGAVTGTQSDWSGNVSIGGTLTYEDVTNIDAVGLITARTGIEFGARPGVGASISADGNAIFSGITTFGGAISGTTGTFSGNITANGNIVGDNSTDISGINDVTISMLSISDTITHTGDTNTKLRFPAADTITAETGGSERVRIDSSGRLMVGNTAAASMFSVANNLVVGSGSGSEGMTIYSDSTNDGYICFADGASDPAYRMGQIIYSHQLNKLQIRTNGNTDRLVIDSSGNTNISGVTTAKTFVPTEYQLGNRNILYNGAMQVAQRATQVTGKANVNDVFTADRWKSIISNGGTYTVEQTTEGPADTGFNKAFRLTCTTADNAGQNNLGNADGYVAIEQRLEGFDVQGIQKGTTSAKPLAISFWCKSNQTGTYNVEVYDNDNGRRVGSQFTVSSADTWERKTFTFAGDTTGALGNDNGDSLRFRIFLAAGNNFRTGTNSGSWAANTKNQRAQSNVNLSTATSKYFALTGVQMEVGSQPTPFEWISYGDELARCQRYYEVLYMSSGTACCYATGDSTYKWAAMWYFKQEKRAQASVALLDDASFTLSGGGAITLTGIFTSKDHAMFYYDSGLFRLGDNDQHASVKAESEL